jgi:hypothetical protein
MAQEQDDEEYAEGYDENGRIGDSTTDEEEYAEGYDENGRIGDSGEDTSTTEGTPEGGSSQSPGTTEGELVW